MRLAKPTSIVRVSDEMRKLLDEIAEENGVDKVSASKLLATKIIQSKNSKKVNWSII